MDDEKQSFQELKEKEENNKKEKPEFKTWNGKRFYYIAGYTPGGIPYGITWEKYKQNISEDDTKKTKSDFLDRELPF